MTNEEFYDEEIGPALAALGKKCEEHGMPLMTFVGCASEDDPSLCATTTTWPEGCYPDVGRRILMDHAMKGGNIDSLVFAFANHVRESGQDHSSVVLLAVGLQPKAEDRS